MRAQIIATLLLCVASAQLGFTAEPNPFLLIAGAGPMDTISGASAPYFPDGVAPGKRATPTPEAMIEKFGAKLDLDGQQRMDIQIIVADYQPRFKDLTKIGHDITRDLLSVSPAAADYVDQSQAASAAAASVTAEFVTLLAEMRGKLFSVLNPAQRDRLKELAAERREKMRDKVEQRHSPTQ